MWREGVTARDIGLVILDCDGVLVDSEIISARMLIAELADFGLSIDMDFVARHFLGRSYPVVLEEVRRNFGVDLPPDFETRYRARLLAAFDREMRVMPDVEAAIRDMAVPVCVATSSSPLRVAHSLRLVGLWERLGPVCFTASEVRNGKPAPDLFLHAAARMGVSPDRALVIEDSITGVKAGLAAGMTVWRFIGGSHLAPEPEPEPEGARPHLRFDRFATFFDRAPELRTRG